MRSIFIAIALLCALVVTSYAVIQHDVINRDTGASGGGTTDDDLIEFDDADSNFTATKIGPAIEELDDTNVSGPNAADAKVDYSQLGNVPIFRETMVQLRPQANEPPGSSFATMNQRNSHPALRFNGDVCAIWSFVLPSYYGGNGVTVDIWVVSLETTNDTDWDISWERIATG